MEDNLVPLSPELKVKVEETIEALYKELDFTVSLTSAQRKYYTKIGILLEPFIRNTYHLSKEEDRLTRNIEARDEFFKNYELWNGLDGIMQKLKLLTEAVEDTSMLSGYNAMMGAFQIYRDALINKEGLPEKDKILREMEDYLPMGNFPLRDYGMMVSNK
ncbi:MAG: hypothetical protein LWX56_02035 [Ignavibacteria bacterium]|nr:hypothetical protein [Ignavibacteria bacterium]